MVKVTFTDSKPPKSQYDVDDVRNTIIDFLINNGVRKEHAGSFVQVLDSSKIGFRFGCSNSNYTRAFALLLILLSENQSKICGYITHTNNIGEITNDTSGCSIYFNIYKYPPNDPYKTICNWISQNMEVNVES